jgi:DNA helicase II / ATP-dependent DNA helicase PcrA
MAWDDGLIGAARNIAGTKNTPLRVMAAPGTGKSFAMKRRVARLLEGGAESQADSGCDLYSKRGSKPRR